MKIDPQHPLGGPPGQGNQDTHVPPGQAKKDFDTVLNEVGQEAEYEPPVETKPETNEYEPESSEEILQPFPDEDPAERRIKAQKQEAQLGEQEGIEEDTIDQPDKKVAYGDRGRQMNAPKIVTSEGGEPVTDGTESAIPAGTKQAKAFGSAAQSTLDLPEGEAVQSPGNKTVPQSSAPGQVIRSIATGATGPAAGTSAPVQEGLLTGPEKAQSIKEAIAGLTERGEIAKGGPGTPLSQQSADAGQRILNTSKLSEEPKGVKAEHLASLGVSVGQLVEPPAPPKVLGTTPAGQIPLAELDRFVNQVVVGVNASGQPEFNLNLNLSELGDMNVRIIRVENGIAVIFNSQTEKGALQLGQNLSSLQTALEQKGLVVQNIQMMVQNQVVPLQQLIPQTPASAEQRPVRKDSKDSKDAKDSKETTRAQGPGARGGKS